MKHKKINRASPTFLGVRIAEQALSQVFNGVKVMPYGNPGYDFIGNNGELIDAKSACITGKYPHWVFGVNRNTIAEFFVLIAFDNRRDLNPLHIWLIPGTCINHLKTVVISQLSLGKWNQYCIDPQKMAACCSTINKSLPQADLAECTNQAREYRKEHLLAHLEGNAGIPLKKAIALYCLHEGISKATAHEYLTDVDRV